MLVDKVTVIFKAGNGGNGRISFKHLPGKWKGGPDGGNGGNGGDLYLQGINDILALSDFRFKKEMKAEDGVGGGKKELFGRNGEDITVRIPIGTLITNEETGETLEITNDTDKILFCKGGKGGRGNNEFKSATNQAPRIAEKGGLGEEKKVLLELKLIADIGFIGLPNAGKSSLLSVLTNANPKIGNYAFTTLEPNIGMMGNVALADIPGLIEGASEGKGLGIDFLRHVEKTKILIHCISVENEDVLTVYKTIRKELKEYSPILDKKPEIIFLTKKDLISYTEMKEKVLSLQKTKRKILPVSIYDLSDITIIKQLLATFVKKSV